MQDTYGPPLGKRLLLFVDDINMPRTDAYGTQQPIALLKQFLERRGFYDRGKELTWKTIKDVQIVAAAGPPGGARNALDPRFLSLFVAFEVQRPGNDMLRTIFQVPSPPPKNTHNKHAPCTHCNIALAQCMCGSKHASTASHISSGCTTCAGHPRLPSGSDRHARADKHGR